MPFRTRLRMGASAVLGLWALLCLASSSCRKGSASKASSFNAIALPDAGAHGCNGTNQAFTPPQTPTVVPLVTLTIGGMSQIAAVQGEDVLYATGAAATVVALDFTAGTPPVETELVPPGVVDALLTLAGITAPAEISGIAILDDTTLLVVEHASNTILAVDRSTGEVSFFAGLPSEVPGFADGFGPFSRFSFTHPTQLVPSGDNRVFVADTGNHAIRQLSLDSGDPPGPPFVFTLVGSGAPGFLDGDLGFAGFDTPVGLNLACNGSLYVCGTGEAGVGGNRLRALLVGDNTFFGLLGSVATLAGDGVSATIGGNGDAASLAAPVAIASTSEGDVYWLDSATGILRRYATGTGDTDCPLFSDCATALGGPANFTSGGRFSLAISASDVLYVLDADAAALLRVTP